MTVISVVLLKLDQIRRNRDFRFFCARRLVIRPQDLCYDLASFGLPLLEALGCNLVNRVNSAHVNATVRLRRKRWYVAYLKMMVGVKF